MPKAKTQEGKEDIELIRTVPMPWHYAGGVVEIKTQPLPSGSSRSTEGGEWRRGPRILR